MLGQQVENMPVARLGFGLSPRSESHDPDHVAVLAEVLDDVPPVVVQAGSLRVIDGVHRVLAARSRGRSTIRAVIFEGDDIAAQVEALRCNVEHGKPLSLAERREAATRLLGIAPDWSDRRIGAVSGLSPKTVSRLRSRAGGQNAQSRGRVGQDGRTRPVDPSAVRRRVADAIRSDAAASNRAIARRTGASPATVRDVRDRVSRGVSELLDDSRQGREAPPARPGCPDLSAWLDHYRIDDADWKALVDEIPISRVYEMADAALRCSDSWRDFAVALEDRARSHRRSGGGERRSP